MRVPNQSSTNTMASVATTTSTSTTTRTTTTTPTRMHTTIACVVVIAIDVIVCLAFVSDKPIHIRTQYPNTNYHGNLQIQTHCQHNVFFSLFRMVYPFLILPLASTHILLFTALFFLLCPLFTYVHVTPTGSATRLVRRDARASQVA